MDENEILEACIAANGEIVKFYLGQLYKKHNLLQIGFKLYRGSVYQWVYDGNHPRYYPRRSSYEKVFSNPKEAYMVALEGYTPPPEDIF